MEKLEFISVTCTLNDGFLCCICHDQGFFSWLGRILLQCLHCKPKIKLESKALKEFVFYINTYSNEKMNL
jgi:hypothetical protein